MAKEDVTAMTGKYRSDSYCLSCGWTCTCAKDIGPIEDPVLVAHKTIIELVHEGYISKGYANRAEAYARLTRAGRGRGVLHAEDGKWYVLSVENIRAYYRAIDSRNMK